ncbi:MAG: hypothetical protein H8E17_07315 [Deltaproteobacteria bacterium]|nr:hypothetical protein [Deltaproteobacteria bacterium]
MDDFDNFDDNFSDNFDDDGDSFEDDSEGEFYDDGLNEETQDESEQEDNGCDIGWEEIAMAGSLSEEFYEEEKSRRRIERKMNKDKDQNDI